MDNQTYLYTVNPRKIITDISTAKVIRSSKSLKLTKDDVYKCLRLASVYRRFASENKIERVTTANVDRLHNEHYMTEEEYKQFIINQNSAEQKQVVDTTPKPEAPAVITNDTTIENSAVATPAPTQDSVNSNNQASADDVTGEEGSEVTLDNPSNNENEAVNKSSVDNNTDAEKVEVSASNEETEGSNDKQDIKFNNNQQKNNQYYNKKRK